MIPAALARTAGLNTSLGWTRGACEGADRDGVGRDHGVFRDRGPMSSERASGPWLASPVGADHPASKGLAGARAASEITSGALA